MRKYLTWLEIADKAGEDADAMVPTPATVPTPTPKSGFHPEIATAAGERAGQSDSAGSPGETKKTHRCQDSRGDADLIGPRTSAGRRGSL